VAPAWGAALSREQVLHDCGYTTGCCGFAGIVNRRIGQLAGMVPRQVDAYADEVRPLLEEFKSGRG
jgi:hypothetical protein